MNIFGLEIRKRERKAKESFLGNSWYAGNNYHAEYNMRISAVYRCVEVISDSVAQLPIDIYKLDPEGYKCKFINHLAYDLLNSEPNEDMTRFTFMKTLVTSVLLTGNGYAYIDRDERGNALSMQFIPSTYVTIVYIQDEQGIQRKRYQVTGFRLLVEPRDMVHVLNFSYDGIHGISTLKHAADTLRLSSDSEAHARGFFSGGGNMSGILSVIEGRITEVQKKDILKAWKDTFNSSGGTSNSVAVLTGNMRYDPITVNPAEAQLLETREFNVIDICRFFGVSPVKAFDLSKSSYSTVEATQLAFLTDTLAPMLEKIELELKRKIFLPSEKRYIEVKFDTSELLRADMAALAQYTNTMFQNGGMTINENRKKNNLPPVEGGDTTFVQVNLQPLADAINKPKEVKIEKK